MEREEENQVAFGSKIHRERGSGETWSVERERERPKQEKMSENHFGDDGEGDAYVARCDDDGGDHAGWQDVAFALFFFSPPLPSFFKFQKCTLSD